MTFLKQNWLKIAILFLILVAIFVFGIKDFRIKKSNSSLNNPTSTEDFKFDLDITKLNYTLPTFTKICVPQYKQYCPNGTNCSPMKPSVFILVNETQKKYYRCDNKPCDEYDYNSSISGFYTVLKPIPPKQGEIKISSDGDYYETVSLGLDLYVSQGFCENN